MIKRTFLLAILVLSGLLTFAQGRKTEDFNADWKFYLGDQPELQYGIKDSTKLKKVQLPHDWSILGNFSEKHNTTNEQGALPAGMGWYMKSFRVAKEDQGKKIYIEFDGIYRNATVYLNGKKIGFRAYGYSSYRYDLSASILFGQSNYLAVKVDNANHPSSRWYTGSGIYRNVRLVKTNPIAVAHWGTFVTTPEVNAALAKVNLQVSIGTQPAGDQKVKVISSIVNAAGKEVSQAVSFVNLKDSIGTVNQDFLVKNPHLWSISDPYLYQVRTRVYAKGKWVDQYTTPLGIRTFSFDAKNGFVFNNKPMKILGVCLHHDLGALGAAVNIRATERQLQLLKEMGCNAIRVSHNPPSPELLDLCDRMGFLVMDEAFDRWRKKKNTFDYHVEFDEWHERDLKDMVLRDRNHPSVFMWSIGNEIGEQFDASGTRIAKELVDIVKKYDTSREVTAALTEMEPDKNFVSQANAMNVLGFNYKHAQYPLLASRFPGKSFLATETASALATRGAYLQPADTLQLWPANSKSRYMDNVNGNWTVTAYDNVSAYWGASHEETWLAVKNKPYMSGLFVWAGIDYLGEPHPFNYPARSSNYGIIDLAGFPKDVYYMYQSEWTDKPVLHVLPHWNFKEGEKVQVWAYYNQADEVELFVNGKSQGIKHKTPQQAHVSWPVIFQSGSIKVVSRKAGKEVLSKEVYTAKAASQIQLVADRSTIAADGKDLSFITVNILDTDGNLVPDAMNNISFSMDGQVEIAGVDNGYQANLQSFQANRINAYNGKALLIIRGLKKTGTVNITASSPGLNKTTIKLNLN